ncbi:hypothetical protein NH340_JMT05206 [Sarcoptes scabiei]|nr:hypothetical protein NH340_JMT05206 [Sarcoptes scabiei]
MPLEIDAIVLDDLIPADAIVYTASLHTVPTIGLANRDCLYSDKTLFGSYMRTTPSYSNQADVIINLLDYLEFGCVHFIVSDSIDGRDFKTRFIALAEEYNLDIEFLIEYDHSRPSLWIDLEALKEMNSSCRVNVLHADFDNAEEVLDQINHLNMTSHSDDVWIVSEQALEAPNLPIGSLGIRYQNWNDSDLNLHITDSIYVIANAIKQMYEDNVTISMPPNYCRDIGLANKNTGPILLRYLRNQTIIFGKTGKISFNERGDRLNGDYEILNQQSTKSQNNLSLHENEFKTVGRYYYDKNSMRMRIDLTTDLIVWSGDRKGDKPVGYSTPEHLRIATLAEIPFVWVLPTNKYNDCDPGQVLCPINRFNTSTDRYTQQNFCCEGYCIDLLIQLANQLNFTYTLHQVEDGLYGSYTFNEKTGDHEWTGLLGELYYNRADMVVAALTITPERSEAIDFSKPFKYQGITILQKQQAINRLGHPLTSFLQPFQNSLWVSVFVAVHVVALALYLLDRFSPFGRYKLPNCETITEEDALNLSSAIWFAWGVLFNSGIGEGTPRSFSGRVLGMVWAGFAMIIVASYTANLAAFLVLDRPQTALSGINDPRLRTPPEGFNYSTVRHSSVDNYFKRQVELAPMHKRMSQLFYDSVEDAIAAVKSGSLSAFIWDSARLEYEAANDCELIISGEHFGRSGYAIGFPKGNAYFKNSNSIMKLFKILEKFYWKKKISLSLLGLHEIGFMEDLDNKWILLNEQVCAIKPEQFPPTLGLKNMAGVFILVATGILGGIGLIMFEIFYKRHQTKKQRRLELARNAWDRWKELVQKQKLRKESLRRAAQQRCRDQLAYHRRRHQLRQLLRSTSDERYSTSSSIDTNLCNNHSSNCTSREESLTTQSTKSAYPDIRDTSFSRPSTIDFASRRLKEQHPVASARIYKPKLRREFSVAYEHSPSPECSFRHDQ